VLDVMMPEMDGFSLGETIEKDPAGTACDLPDS
jgi:CheY-like chemotaxis protein